MDLSMLPNPFVSLTIIMGILVFYTQWFETPSSILRPLPGPRAWPVIGNLLDLAAARFDVDELHRRLARAYGAVVSYRVFGHRVVVISDRALAQQALDHEDICGRVRDEWRDTMSESRHVGILKSSGHAWKEHREVVAKFFTDIVESGHLEKVCRAEAEVYSESVDIINSIAGVVTNILCKSIFGKKYDVETLLELTNLLIEKRTKDEASGAFAALYSLLPSFVQKLPFIGRREKRRRDTELIDLIGKLIDERDCDPSTASEKCLIDVYRKEMEERWNNADNNHVPSLSDASLLWTCYDLLTIGVSRTLQLLYQATVFTERNPDVQARLKEIALPLISNSPKEGNRVEDMAADHVTQTKWLPSDRAYVDAVLLETNRLESCLEFDEKLSDRDWKWSTSRVAEADVELGNDYDIPQDSIVTTMATVPADTRDEAFRPERFLTTDGALVDSPCVKPFGTGKRVCPAASMTSTVFRVLLCRNFANAAH